MKTTKAKRLSYLGQAFDCYAVQARGPKGLRIWVKKNAETGALDYRVIKGSTLAGTFRLYEVQEAATQGQIDQAIAQMTSGHYDNAPALDRTLAY